MDNLLLATKSAGLMCKIKLELSTHLKMKDSGPVSEIVGIQTEREEDRLNKNLTKKKYV